MAHTGVSGGASRHGQLSIDLLVSEIRRIAATSESVDSSSQHARGCNRRFEPDLFRLGRSLRCLAVTCFHNFSFLWRLACLRRPCSEG